MLGGLVWFGLPTPASAALSEAQLSALATAVDACVSSPSTPGCFPSTPPLGPTSATSVYNSWKAQLTVGTTPNRLIIYSTQYVPATLTGAARTAQLLADLTEWKIARDKNVAGTGDTTTTPAGGTGTTPGTDTTPVSSGGALLNMNKKPADYATQALDTSNFLQDAATYGWATDVWQTMRQMSNILIVVFLFIGALATTLNYNLNTYGIKRVLPSVIQAAILANFSYIIMNMAVEAVGLVQQGLLGLGGAEVDASTWSKLASPLRDVLEGLRPAAGSTFFQVTWGIIVAFGIGIALLLLWLVVFVLYLRSFVIAMLVCFAPLAILSMALPATQGLWKKWWDEFVKWLLLPLVVCFWLMLASLIAATAIPLYLKLVIVMFAVFQGVRAPFSFKPAIMGAAIGYGAAQLTGLGKYMGERAVYGNNLTGGVLRGADRWKQSRAASLAANKDSSTIIKGNNTQPPGPNASRWARFKYNALGNRGRIGRSINSAFEGLEGNVEDFKTGEGISKSQAQIYAAQGRNIGGPETRGQRRARLALQGTDVQGEQDIQNLRDKELAATTGEETRRRIASRNLEKERLESGLSEMDEDDTVAAAEADPQIMQDIAALNQSKETLSNVMESLKTGAKSAALATNESLKTEKKLSEFRKNEAANLLKQVEASINQDALNEASPLGIALKGRLASDANLRGTLESYGMHIKPDGSGYMEGMMQNELNAVSATEAYESAVKKQQLLIATRDSHRHKKLSKIAEKIPNRAVTAADLPTYLEDSTQKTAAAEQLEKQLRVALSPEEFERFGIGSLVSNVESGAAGSDDELADAINLYNNKDATAVATRRGVSVDPNFDNRLESMRKNRIAASLNQGKKVALDKVEKAKGLSETTPPHRRVEMPGEALERAKADDPSLAGVTMSDVRVAHAMGANEGYSNGALKGTVHHDLMSQMTVMASSLRETALKGKNGEPDKDSIDNLVNYLDDLGADLSNYARRMYGAVGAAPGPVQENIRNSRRLRSEVGTAYADYVNAHASGDQAAQNKSQAKIRTTLGDTWFNTIG